MIKFSKYYDTELFIDILNFVFFLIIIDRIFFARSKLLNVELSVSYKLCNKIACRYKNAEDYNLYTCKYKLCH